MAAASARNLGMYLHLAKASAQRRRPQVRDRLLIIAAVIAVELQLPRISAHCRRLVLEHNPRHLVKRWPTFEEAALDPEFGTFLKQLWRRYPLEKVEEMLQSLDIELGREREAYYNDEEYAAALLGLSPDGLP